jgi:GGDEF domain-containing protein
MLVASSDGTVSGVLPGEGPSAGGLAADGVPSSLTALWPADVCAQIGDCVRRCLRSRYLESMDLEIAEPADRLKLIFVPHGRDSALIVVLDVGEPANAYSRMADLAYVDRATTLPTREYFLEEIARFTDIARLKELRAAVICLSIEQSEGHGNAFSGQSQDVVLKELAGRLVLSLRGVNRRDELDYERYSVAARIDYRQYGVMRRASTAAPMPNVAVRLIGASAACHGRQPTVTVTARAGLALFPQDGADADTLFRMRSRRWKTRNSQTTTTNSTPARSLRALRQRARTGARTALERDNSRLDYLPS